MRVRIRSWKSIFEIGVLVVCAVGLLTPLPVYAGACPGDPAAIGHFSDCENCTIDLNNDGSVTTGDLLAVRKCIQKGCGDLRYDVDGDGKVAENDAGIILKCRKLSISSAN